MAKLNGWVGKILRVDLTTGEITDVLTENYADKFIGGRGIGAKIYWDEVPPEVGAFDPGNKLIFMTGPLTGTTAPGSGRVNLCGKNAVTYPMETYWKSAAGGHFGPELKFAGYDGIIIQGKSPKPVYLWIHDGEAEIRDARSLWGLNTHATQDEIWRRHDKKTRAMVIGPAGENSARVAVILTDDGNAFGFGGYGGVMGSKNLKAIAVRGTGGISVAKPDELLNLSYKFSRLMTRKETEDGPVNPNRGNAALIVKDYVPGVSSLKDTGLYEEVEKGNLRLGYQGCFACPIACGISTKFRDGSATGGGTWRCASIICMAYMKGTGDKVVSKEAYIAEKLFNLLGVSMYQTFNWGITFNNWFRRLLDEGILTEENTGLPIHNLDSLDFAYPLINGIAYREGIGDKMAEGPQRFLAYLENKFKEEGDLEKAKKVREIAEEDCGLDSKFRGSYTRNGYDVDDTGWDPYRALTRVIGETQNAFLEAHSVYTWLPYSYEIWGPEYAVPLEAYKKVNKELFGHEKAWDLSTWEGKAEKAIGYQRYARMLDSLLWCEWNTTAFSCYTPDKIGDWNLSPFYSAVTGINKTYEDLFITAADRILNLERAIAVREGRRREDEWFVDRVFEIEQNKTWLTKEKLSETLDKYYTLMGWDVATGIPTRARLEGLGLTEVANDLEERGLLP